MKVTFLVQSAHKQGGTERSAITQANALAAAGHTVRILSVVKAAEQPAFAIDERVAVEHLVDLTAPYDEALHARESVLVPPRWDKQFSALTDVALEAGLRRLDADVLVTVTPALLACAVQLAPDAVVVVHQEHRSSSQRTSGMEPLLVNAPRADVVALLTPTIARLAARRARTRWHPRSWWSRTRSRRASHPARCSTPEPSSRPAGW